MRVHNRGNVTIGARQWVVSNVAKTMEGSTLGTRNERKGSTGQAIRPRIAKNEIGEESDQEEPGTSDNLALATHTLSTRKREIAEASRQMAFVDFATALGMYLETPPQEKEARKREIGIIMHTVKEHKLLPTRAARILTVFLNEHAQDPIAWEIKATFETFSRAPEVELDKTGITTNEFGDFDQTIGLRHAGLVGPAGNTHFLRLLERPEAGMTDVPKELRSGVAIEDIGITDEFDEPEDSQIIAWNE